MAHAILGDVYVSLGKYHEANIEYLLAEKIYGAALFNLKVSDVSDLYVKLTNNAVNLKDNLQVLYYLNLHKETFGNNHRNTIILTRNLISLGLINS